MFRPWLALLIFPALPAFAQRDFLTPDEVDEIFDLRVLLESALFAAALDP